MMTVMKNRLILLLLPSILIIALLSCNTLQKKRTHAWNKQATKVTNQNMEITPLKQKNIIITKHFLDKERYSLFFSLSAKGPIIPGLQQQAVPQGLFYHSERDWFLISNYMNNEKPSNITIINATTTKHTKTLWLQTAKSSPFTGHVGGISVSKNYVWVASGGGVYAVSLSKIDKTENNSFVILDSYYETEAKASFASYNEDILWVGEFARYTKQGRVYQTKEYHHMTARDKTQHNGWIVGYKIVTKDNPNDEVKILSSKSTPDYILSIPDKVQGIAFVNNLIILSISYGRKNDSFLYFYKNPMMDKPHKMINLKNKQVPLWFLDNTNKIIELISPPMTEGITNYRGKVAVLFESGSDKYRPTSSFPIDSIYIVDIDKL